MRQDKAQVTIMTMNLRFGLAKDNENGWQHRKPLVETLLIDIHRIFLASRR